MRFRLVPKPTTLNDLERPLQTLFKIYAIFGVNLKTLNDVTNCLYTPA